MIDLKSSYWAGTPETFEFALSAHNKTFEAVKLNDEMPEASLLSVQGSVGVVRIAGPLVDGSAGWMSFFGVTGYNDIREAVVKALADPKVKTIMLDVNSGGGQVSGVDDLSSLLRQASAIKPITTFADGMMASAAYWLGSSGSHLTASKTAIVGSIGVLSKHTEYSQADAKEGIKSTIVRAGRYKALANSVEPLSAEARAEIQQQANDIYEIFITRVAENRGVSTVVADAQMGQGREFLGKRALEAGLVDEIGTYESALARAQALADNLEGARSTQSKSKEGSRTMPKATLTPQQLAAIASGAQIDAALETAEDAVNSAAEAAAALAAETQTDDKSATEQAGETVEDEAGATESQANAAPTAANESGLVAYLQSQVAAKDADLLKANIELDKLRNQVTEASATHEGLLAIARDSVGKMKVALGGSAEAAAAMSAVEVLAAHAETSEVFKTKFKVGGVAATATTETEKRPAALVDPMFASLVKAAKA